MIPLVEMPENIKVKVSANVEDTTDIILLNLQIALTCMMEAKNLFMECHHGTSVMTDLLDDCIGNIETIINTNPEMREDGEYNDDTIAVELEACRRRIAKIRKQVL